MPNFLVYKLYPPSFIQKLLIQSFWIHHWSILQMSEMAAYLFEASEGNLDGMSVINGYISVHERETQRSGKVRDSCSVPVF